MEPTFSKAPEKPEAFDGELMTPKVNLKSPEVRPSFFLLSELETDDSSSKSSSNNSSGKKVGEKATNFLTFLMEEQK